MSDNNNKFQSRLDAILKVEIVLHVNGDWHELQIESSDNRLTSGALKYTQHVSLFPGKTSYSFVGVSEDGAIVNAFIHDGTSKDNGGYGSDPFELTMKDGSHKVITGPWSGRPSVHTTNSGIQYAEVRVGYGMYGFTREFIEAIIDRYNVKANVELITHKYEDRNEIELQVTPK
jgi:hypothetical protein